MIGHFGDGYVLSNTCTGTDKLTRTSNKLNTHKNNATQLNWLQCTAQSTLDETHDKVQDRQSLVQSPLRQPARKRSGYILTAEPVRGSTLRKTLGRNDTVIERMTCVTVPANILIICFITHAQNGSYRPETGIIKTQFINANNHSFKQTGVDINSINKRTRIYANRLSPETLGYRKYEYRYTECIEFTTFRPAQTRHLVSAICLPSEADIDRYEILLM